MEFGSSISWIGDHQCLRGGHFKVGFIKTEFEQVCGYSQFDWLNGCLHLEVEQVHFIDDIRHLPLEVLEDRRRKVYVKGRHLGGWNDLLLGWSQLQFFWSRLVNDKTHQDGCPQFILNSKVQHFGALDEHRREVHHFRIDYNFL